MRGRILLAALAVVIAGAATVALAVVPDASAQEDRRPPAQAVTASPAALAAAAADKVAGSGVDALAKGADDAFVRRSVVGGSGGLQYVTYDRTYRGLPVVGGDAVVVTDAAGRVRDTLAADYGRVSLADLTPRVGGEQATAVARQRLDKVQTVGKAQLVVHALTATPRLAWEVLLSGAKDGAPSRLHVYVDAQNASVLSTKDDVVYEAARGYYNGSIQIDTTGGTLRDPGRSGLSCGNYNSRTTYTDGGTGAGTDLQTACVDAFYAVEREWDMLRTWLGRSGIDGSGRAFPLSVGLSDVNAYWDGSSGTFGHNQAGNQQATNLDVVGHEMGHAIDQYTGAGTAAENGLGEGTGDIFGALTEWYANNPNDPPDYTVGEEVNLVGSGPIRYMYRPSTDGDPDCYSSAIPRTEVHSAAGPLNHWFYLVAEGTNPSDGQPTSPTCNGTTVPGVGIQKAGQIFLGAMNMKTSGWSYAKYRGATLRAAVNLFGANSQKCNTVKAGWSAVSVPAQSGEPACGTAQQNDFSLNLSPSSGSVAQGGTVSATVATQVTSGTAQTVSLSASGAGHRRHRHVQPGLGHGGRLVDADVHGEFERHRRHPHGDGDRRRRVRQPHRHVRADGHHHPAGQQLLTVAVAVLGDRGARRRHHLDGRDRDHAGQPAAGDAVGERGPGRRHGDGQPVVGHLRRLGDADGLGRLDGRRRHLHAHRHRRRHLLDAGGDVHAHRVRRHPARLRRRGGLERHEAVRARRPGVVQRPPVELHLVLHRRRARRARILGRLDRRR
ncbi:MAG TPA: M4 family metallopeptidase [Dactylosporangium sp.]|nr:M4 family metallopeptidase [Dactylosporangium sp.]